MPDSSGPRISIVTPCLNSVSTLAKALDSVPQQGFADIEHIVVDGGSTDGTIELLATRTNVKWISEPDKGLSDAVNKGIAMASGDLVGWLNADDWYLPGAFDAVVAATVIRMPRGSPASASSSTVMATRCGATYRTTRTSGCGTTRSAGI